MRCCRGAECDFPNGHITVQGGDCQKSLRGTEQLCIDLFESPTEVKAALEEIDRSWFKYWRGCNDPILRHQQGYVDWARIWSECPMVTVECDYSCMISPDMFEEFFLPSVIRQTAMVDRSIYHLDGPDAIRHLDALLALETLDGIQWVPGAGAKPAGEWIPLLQRIQEAGKLVVMSCGPEEVPVLLDSLEPGGLLLETRTASPTDADDLVEAVKGNLPR